MSLGKIPGGDLFEKKSKCGELTLKQFSSVHMVRLARHKNKLGSCRCWIVCVEAFRMFGIPYGEKYTTATRRIVHLCTQALKFMAST